MSVSMVTREDSDLPHSTTAKQAVNRVFKVVFLGGYEKSYHEVT